jgi:hypothetical protein
MRWRKNGQELMMNTGEGFEEREKLGHIYILITSGPLKALVKGTLIVCLELDVGA